MNKSDRDWNIQVYSRAVSFLEDITPAGINLEKYYVIKDSKIRNLRNVYYQFIRSAQNYQQMPNVIAFDSRKKDIEEILYGYDYKKISEMNPKNLYKEFRRRFKIKSEDSKYNSWSKWSNSIVDAAKFMKEFRNIEDFRSFVERFDYNVHTSMALPLLISEKINGIGFALACDLLKELGFTRYPKPDVHLKEVFSKLGLSDDDPISTFEAIVRMSDICKDIDESVTPYKVDKIIWLICSGKYYLEKPMQKQPGRKKEFIKLLSKEK